MLQIRLLGQFDVRLHGKLASISARSGQSLLAHLAFTAGTPHLLKMPAGIFWLAVHEDTCARSCGRNYSAFVKLLRDKIRLQIARLPMISPSPLFAIPIIGQLLPSRNDPIWILSFVPTGAGWNRYYV